MTSTPGSEAPYADTMARARALLVEEALDHDALDVLARLDRWLPDLAAGLDAVYEDADLLGRVVDLVLRAHLDRPERLRARDRERVLRPDWFQLPSCIGYAAYADRFAGDLPGVRDQVAIPRGARGDLSPPDAAARAAAGAARRWVRRRRLPRRPGRPRHDGRPARPGRHPPRERHRAHPRPGPQPRGPRARVGARARAGEEKYRAYFRLFPDRRARRLRGDAARGVPGDSTGQLHVGRRGGGVGLDDVQRLAVGPRLVQPRRAVRVRRDRSVPGQPGCRLPAPGRHRLPVEAPGHRQPEPARGARDHARRCARSPGSAHPPWCSRPRPSSGRGSSSPTWGPASTPAR